MAWRKHAWASSSRPSSWRTLPRMVSASGKSGRSLTASRQCVKACAGWPNSSSISPRLLWASAETGSSCTAWRKCSIAETLSPRSRSVLARLLWAAKPGRSRIASRKWVTASSTAPADQCCPEITVTFGMIGLKLQGGPIGVDGAIKLPERPERLGEGGVISRLGGADRDRPAHKRGRPPGISPLERDQPQEVESLGMLRRLSQGRLIQARGLLEPALLV